MLTPWRGWPDSAPACGLLPLTFRLLGGEYAQQDRANPAALYHRLWSLSLSSSALDSAPSHRSGGCTPRVRLAEQPCGFMPLPGLKVSPSWAVGLFRVGIACLL